MNVRPLLSIMQMMFNIIVKIHTGATRSTTQIPHILPKSIHDDDGDDYDNEGYEEEPQEDAVWDGAVDVARSHEDYTALQHQPYQPHYPTS